MPDMLFNIFSFSSFQYLASMLLLLNLVCIIVSVAIVNYDSSYYILITIIVCGLNCFLVIDIAFLLTPFLANVIGSPVRPEYGFALLSITILATLIYNGDFPETPFKYLVNGGGY